jgi:xylose isomerase
MGHGLALGFQTNDPIRVGVLMESAHAILVGLDPSDEISFAMSSGKLMSVHLNDQNGLKYDQDRSFGSVDLRRAFNQVRILDTYQYWKIGMIGLDVKAIRTQPAAIATKHLRNSLHTFLRLVEVARSLDQQAINALIAQRDYEELDWLILNSLMGR